MPRCNCGAATCSCTIVADPADGIEVSGHGSTAQPYRLKNIRSDALARVNIVDTDTVDLTFEPTDLNDPNTEYTLRADAVMGLVDLSDVDHTEPPVTGDIPTWDGTQWIFSPAATGLPPGGTDGQVVTKVAGSPAWANVPHELPVGGTAGQVLSKASGTDYAVNWQSLAAATGPSGVWGTPPLNIYGDSTKTLYGREIYVDANGQFRAKPDVIQNSAGLFTQTTAVDQYPPGTSVMSVPSAEAANWPAGGSCTVVTHKRVDTTTAGQWCYANSSAVSKAWYRNATGAAWGPWQQVSGALVEKPATDLPDTWQIGVSVAPVTSGGTGATWPATAGTVVTSRGQAGVATQRFATAGSIAAGATSWMRNSAGNAWGPWVMDDSGATPYIARSKNANQNLTNASTYYTVTFEVDDLPAVGITYSGGVFTVPEDGIYQLDCNILAGGVATPQMRLSITITNPSESAVNVGNPAWNNSGNSMLPFSRAIRMKAGCTLTISAYANATGQNITGSSTNYTTMSLTKIAP